jgi:hypothetical protein
VIRDESQRRGIALRWGGAQMNLAAATIAGGIGTIFFAAASLFYYQPSFIKPEKVLDAVLTTNQSKARNAVSRLLLHPASAEFDGLRSVEVDGKKYVCGSVRAKDHSGAYAGHRAFVYTVAIDFARIDDDGSIAQRHDAYRTCPVTVEEEKVAKLRLSGPPNAVAAVKNLTGGSMHVGTGGVGGAMQQQLQHLAGEHTVSSGGQVGGSFKVASAKPVIAGEADWQAGKPPVGWPVFLPEDELSKPVSKRSNAEALAQAKTVEERWALHKSDSTKPRPSMQDIRDAERALLAIDASGPDFRAAWAAFVRLRAIEREAGA